MVATPHGVWHRDSLYRRKFVGGDTRCRDTDCKKRKIKRSFAKFLGFFNVVLFFVLLENIMGSGWSPPPMGFGVGILITGGTL